MSVGNYVKFRVVLFIDYIYPLIKEIIMKKTLTFLLICLTLITSAQTGMLNGSGYAPDITVADINGNTHNLYNYLDSGKVVVLELMSVTCGHCQAHAAGTENSYQWTKWQQFSYIYWIRD